MHESCTRRGCVAHGGKRARAWRSGSRRRVHRSRGEPARPYAGRRGHKIRGGDFGDIPPCLRCESVLAHRAAELSNTHTPVLARERAKLARTDHLSGIREADIAAPVLLAGECAHGVWPDINTAAHPAREVNAQ